MPAQISAGELRGIWQFIMIAELDTPLPWGYDPIQEGILRPEATWIQKHRSILAAMQDLGPGGDDLGQPILILREEVPSRM